MGATAKVPLKVKDLRVALGGREVLCGVDLEIHPASLVGLVGPNGAGKTTLLRSILGLIPVLSGEVEVGGKKGRLAARAIGYVPQRQEFAWDYPISVENVVMSGFTGLLGPFRRPKKAHWEAVYQALAQVKLADLHDRTVGELSGGQRQRVLIARALATNPDILLLDEPFTGLDQPTMDLLLELFTDLARNGSSLLMSTHDLAGAVMTCDRLVLLNKHIQADGSPQELQDPQLWMDTYKVSEKSPLIATIASALQARPTELAATVEDSAITGQAAAAGEAVEKPADLDRVADLEQAAAVPASCCQNLKEEKEEKDA